MSLEPRGRQGHRKTGPRPPGACSKARAKPATRLCLRARTREVGPFPREPLQLPQQPRPGLGPPSCSIGHTKLSRSADSRRGGPRSPRSSVPPPPPLLQPPGVTQGHFFLIVEFSRSQCHLIRNEDSLYLNSIMDPGAREQKGPKQVPHPLLNGKVTGLGSPCYSVQQGLAHTWVRRQ